MKNKCYKVCRGIYSDYTTYVCFFDPFLVVKHVASIMLLMWYKFDNKCYFVM